MSDRKQRRVVCAAIKGHYGLIVTSARHYDTVMHEQLNYLTDLAREGMRDAKQGFIDQWGKFMTRREAFKVATEAGQIIKKTGNPDSLELFSEDIY